MKDYIKMFVLDNSYGTMNMVSEVFMDEEEAKHFAACFQHNYNCTAYVRHAMSDDGYVVFADRVDPHLIRANISSKSNEGLFANWKFESRRFDQN